MVRGMDGSWHDRDINMLQKGLKVRMININGIQNKTEHVIKYMGKEKADIMILVEAGRQEPISKMDSV